MGPLDALLQVQEHDLALDRLAHRRAALPERVALAEVEAALARVGAAEAETGARRGELATRQARLDSDIEATGRRIREVEGRLYGGEVSASRELSAMAAEVESLKRHRSDLEDRDLAVLVEAEPVDAALTALAEERAALSAEGDGLASAIAEAEGAIAAEEAAEREARQAAAAGLPSDLARQYERLRGRLGGVGAARLVNGSCTGCHLTLPAAERDRLRHLPPDAVATCDQCGRILVT